MHWFNRDPKEEDAGINLYSFCDNNPVVAYDRLGDIAVRYISAPKTHGRYPTIDVIRISDIAVEERNVKNEHGGFDPVSNPLEGDCVLEVRLTIYLSPTLTDSPVPGITYTYEPHYPPLRNNRIPGGISSTIPEGFPQIRDEVLAHERGHAWAFLLFTKPIFDAYVAGIVPPLSKEDVTVVKRYYRNSRQLTASQNAEYANNATFEWYKSQGFSVKAVHNGFEFSR